MKRGLHIPEKCGILTSVYVESACGNCFYVSANVLLTHQGAYFRAPGRRNCNDRGNELWRCGYISR